MCRWHRSPCPAPHPDRASAPPGAAAGAAGAQTHPRSGGKGGDAAAPGMRPRPGPGPAGRGCAGTAVPAPGDITPLGRAAWARGSFSGGRRGRGARAALNPRRAGGPGAVAPPEGENGAVPAHTSPCEGTGAAALPARAQGGSSRAGSRNSRDVPPSGCPSSSCGLCFLSPGAPSQGMPRDGGRRAGGSSSSWMQAEGERQTRREAGAAPAAPGSSSPAALPLLGGSHMDNGQTGPGWVGCAWEGMDGGARERPLLRPAANSRSRCLPSAAPLAKKGFGRLGFVGLCPCGHWGCPGVQWEGS